MKARLDQIMGVDGRRGGWVKATNSEYFNTQGEKRIHEVTRDKSKLKPMSRTGCQVACQPALNQEGDCNSRRTGVVSKAWKELFISWQL